MLVYNLFLEDNQCTERALLQFSPSWMISIQCHRVAYLIIRSVMFLSVLFGPRRP
jgi:hypothetical protein